VARSAARRSAQLRRGVVCIRHHVQHGAKVCGGGGEEGGQVCRSLIHGFVPGGSNSVRSFASLRRTKQVSVSVSLARGFVSVCAASTGYPPRGSGHRYPPRGSTAKSRTLSSLRATVMTPCVNWRCFGERKRTSQQRSLYSSTPREVDGRVSCKNDSHFIAKHRSTEVHLMTAGVVLEILLYLCATAPSAAQRRVPCADD